MSQPNSTPKGKSYRLKPWHSFLEHKLIFSLIVFIFSFASIISFFLIKPYYYAEGVIEVYPKYISNLGDNSELQVTGFREFVANQIVNLRSTDVVEKTLALLKDKPHPLQEVDDDLSLIYALQSGLSVKQIGLSTLISVGFAGNKPEGLAELINTLLETYLRKMNGEKIVGQDIRTENLSRRKNELSAELTVLLSRKSQVLEKLGVSAIQDHLETPHEQSMVEINQSLVTATKQALEAQIKLYSADEGLGVFSKIDMDASVTEKLENDPYLVSLKQALSTRKINLITQMAGTSENHPGRKASLKEIEAIEKEYENSFAREHESALKNLTQKHEVMLITFKDKARQEFEDANLRVDALKKAYDQQKELSSNFTVLYNEAMEIRRNIEHTQKGLDTIESRLEFFKMEEDAPGLVKIASLARTPEQAENDKKLKIVIGLFCFGIFLGLLFPVLIDFLNPLIKTPMEMEGILHFPMLAWLIDNTTQQEGFFFEDQLRRLANAIDYQFSKEQWSAFAFTSVKPGGGTSMIVSELAQKLAEIGRNVLIVEANAFKPKLDWSGKLKEGSNGLWGVLTGQYSSKNSTTNLFSKNGGRVDILPVGNASENSKHLPLTHESLNIIKTHEHDIYLFDCPPLLLSSDSEFLIRLLDATILIVEAEGVGQGEISRAARTLERLNPPQLTFIANRIPVKHRGGYFSQMLKEYETGQKMKSTSFIQDYLFKRNKR